MRKVGGFGEFALPGDLIRSRKGVVREVVSRSHIGAYGDIQLSGVSLITGKERFVSQKTLHEDWKIVKVAYGY